MVPSRQTRPSELKRKEEKNGSDSERRSVFPRNFEIRSKRRYLMDRGVLIPYIGSNTKKSRIREKTKETEGEDRPR